MMEQNIYKNMMEQAVPGAALIEDTKKKMASGIELSKKSKTITEEPIVIKRSFRVAAIIAVITLLLATTAFAAWYLLKPSEVAELFDDHALSAAFESDSAIIVNESITGGDYIFTLLGVLYSESLNDWLYPNGENQLMGLTYAVVAVRHTDGRPLPDTPHEDYWSTDIKMSPFIKGVEPWKANIFTFAGGISSKVVDGVAYRIVACDDISFFAEHGLYLGIWTNELAPYNAFLYDEQTGEISANPDYDGVSVVFDLPIDKALADPEKVEEFLYEILFLFEVKDVPENTTQESEITTRITTPYVEIDWENAIPVMSTFQEISIDVSGFMLYTYDLGYVSGSRGIPFDTCFSNSETAETFILELSDRWYAEVNERYAMRLSKDINGTVTGVILVPNDSEPEWIKWQMRTEYLMNVPLEECELRPESVVVFTDMFEYAPRNNSHLMLFRTPIEGISFDENGIFRHHSGLIDVRDESKSFLVVIKQNDDGTLTGMVYDVPIP